MGSSCNGKCDREYRENRKYSPYESGQKFCNVCNMWLTWEGMHCPCCNMRIRAKPRKWREYKARKVDCLICKTKIIKTSTNHRYCKACAKKVIKANAIISRKERPPKERQLKIKQERPPKIKQIKTQPLKFCKLCRNEIGRYSTFCKTCDRSKIKFKKKRVYPKMNCERCNTTIDRKAKNQKYCKPCAKITHKAWFKQYYQDNKQWYKDYYKNNPDKFHSAEIKEKHKIWQKEYYQRPDIKAREWLRRRSVQYIEKRKEYERRRKIEMQ